MKTILAPTDYSKSAYSALLYTTQLLRSEKCRFIILHSFEDQVTHMTSRIDIAKTEALVDELYATNDSRSEEVKRRIISDTKNDKHSFDIITTSMSLTRAINRLIVKESVNLVIMSSKGQTAAESIFMGSNTLSVMRKIEKSPMLIIPNEIVYKKIETIAFTTGFKRPYTSTELSSLVFLTAIEKAKIKVLHIQEKDKISDSQRENFHKLFEILNEGKPETHWLPYESDKYSQVLQYLTKSNIDLLAMVYYKHNFLTAMFREAVVKNLAKNIPIPFLIIPAVD